MNASLVIPTYNKINYLKLVLESIKYQTISSERFEVIIVDDGSTDGSREYVENECFHFLHYLSTK